MTLMIRRHPFLTAAFVLSLGLTLFFAGQFVARAIYWSDPAHHEQQVEPWMTLGYIGRSWKVDPRALNAETGLDLPRGTPMTLEEIARQRDIPLDALILDVQAAILRLKAREAAPQATGP